MAVYYTMKINEVIKSQIVDFCHKNNVSLFIVFGSYAKEKARPQSDIDIALVLENEKDYANKLLLIFELEGIFQKQVDLVLLKPTTEPLLRFEIFSTGRPLFMRQSHLFEESKLHAWKIYLDTKKIREMRKKFISNYVRKLKDEFQI